MKTSLRATKDYLLFDRCRENRPVELNKHNTLRKSMQEHGWIPAYPMHVVRNKQGRMVIRDGQHRFEIAKELGIPVWFVECDDSADIAQINNAQQKWGTRDYAGSFAQRGAPDYAILLDFADKHKMPVMTAAHLLGGTVSFGNMRNGYVRGDWKVKDTDFAERVAMLYQVCGSYTKCVKTRAFLDAASACCRVPAFNMDRMIRNVKKWPEMLVPYSTRDAMLDVLQNIYNKGERGLFALKIEAEKAMRARNPKHKNA